MMIMAEYVINAENTKNEMIIHTIKSDFIKGIVPVKDVRIKLMLNIDLTDDTTKTTNTNITKDIWR
jgi:hypothetical protein